jgi:hypothetical protein
MPDGGHHGEGEHDERDVAVPAVPGPGFVVVEAELVLCCFETVFDGPAMTFDLDQCLDRGSRRAPGGKVGEVAIGNITPDQQAACLQAMIFIVEFFGVEIGQFKVAPVMQPRAFGSSAGG